MLRLIPSRLLKRPRVYLARQISPPTRLCKNQRAPPQAGRHPARPAHRRAYRPTREARRKHRASSGHCELRDRHDKTHRRIRSLTHLSRKSRGAAPPTQKSRLIQRGQRSVARANTLKRRATATEYAGGRRALLARVGSPSGRIWLTVAARSGRLHERPCIIPPG